LGTDSLDVASIALPSCDPDSLPAGVALLALPCCAAGAFSEKPTRRPDEMNEQQVLIMLGVIAAAFILRPLIRGRGSGAPRATGLRSPDCA
jgi:hypothetical protein